MNARLMLAPTLVLAAVAATAAEPPGALASLSPEMEAKRQKIESLFQDISTVNLLNGLRLTREQAQQVLALAREAQQVRQGLKGNGLEAYEKALADAEDSYAAFKAAAMKGEPPTGPVSNRAGAVEQRMKDLRDRYSAEVEKRLKDLEARLQNVLTEGQKEVVAGFKPCLIPPQNLRDPVRAGQAASDKPVQILSRMRSIPAAEWNSHKDDIAARHVEMTEKHKYKMLSDQERAAERSRFIALVEQVRALKDTDFELEKTKLAEALQPSDKRDALMEELRKRSPHGGPEVTRAGHWLLSSRVVPILEERLRM
jgi:hypothetical protein